MYRIYATTDLGTELLDRYETIQEAYEWLLLFNCSNYNFWVPKGAPSHTYAIA